MVEAPMSEHPKKVGNDGTIFRCPMCKMVLSSTTSPTFPFCSERCRLLDLSNWVDGKYTLSRPVDPTDQNDENLRRS
jgi:endogenous inhibitor of DNA gyrase (YacG/DUF329 family)